MRKIEKHFIKTDNPTYEIGNNQVCCLICTSLKVRYSDGMSATVHSYIAEGKAKCSSEDKFDLVKGIKIATARAEIDYHKYYRKWLDRFEKCITGAVSSIINLSDDCEGQIKHNTQYINDLIK